MLHKTFVIYVTLALINSAILQAQTFCKTIIHGDSGVEMLRRHYNFPTDICIGISKSGASSTTLIKLLSDVRVNHQIESCIIHIGTNDAYQYINALHLKAVLQSKYPNCKQYYIIWGTIGWGSVTNKTPCDQKRYYSKFEMYGFQSITTVGPEYNWINCIANTSWNYFSTSQSAHQINSKYNLLITKKLQQLK